MTYRFLISLVVALMSGSLLAACAGVQGEPMGARYEIEKRFQRPVGADTLGVRVSDGLMTGSLSQEQVKQLSTFLAHVLRESRRFEMVVDLTDHAKDDGIEMIVNVNVTEFRVASEQERSQGIRSQLIGEVTLTDWQKSNRGLARVEADGVNLEVVGKIQPPDTVRSFAGAILELLQ